MAVKVAGHFTSSILTIQLITVVTSYTILPIACHFEHSPFLCWYKIFKKNYVLSHCALHQLWTHSKNLPYYHEKLQFMCYCYFSDFLNSINVTLTANCNCINVFVISRKTVHEIFTILHETQWYNLTVNILLHLVHYNTNSLNKKSCNWFNKLQQTCSSSWIHWLFSTQWALLTTFLLSAAWR